MNIIHKKEDTSSKNDSKEIQLIEDVNNSFSSPILTIEYYEKSYSEGHKENVKITTTHTYLESLKITGKLSNTLLIMLQNKINHFRGIFKHQYSE